MSDDSALPLWLGLSSYTVQCCGREELRGFRRTQTDAQEWMRKHQGVSVSELDVRDAAPRAVEAHMNSTLWWACRSCVLASPAGSCPGWRAELRWSLGGPGVPYGQCFWGSIYIVKSSHRIRCNCAVCGKGLIGLLPWLYFTQLGPSLSLVVKAGSANTLLPLLRSVQFCEYS